MFILYLESFQDLGLHVVVNGEIDVEMRRLE